MLLTFWKYFPECLNCVRDRDNLIVLSKLLLSRLIKLVKWFRYFAFVFVKFVNAVEVKLGSMRSTSPKEI